VLHPVIAGTESQAGAAAAAPALLAIETAGSQCSAAVTRGRAVLAAECRELRHGHAEVLLPMIARVVQEAGLLPRQLGAVAAAVGPGGFTGIRVGLAAAHGIALAAAAQLVGVSSFAAVAARLAEAGEAADDRALLVALDSRRADLYVQLFAPGGRAPLAPPLAVPPADLARHVAAVAGGARLLVAGDAAAVAAAALTRRRGFMVAAAMVPDALGVAAAARDRLAAGESAGPMLPLYLRPPDVSLPGPRPPFRPGVSQILPLPGNAARPLAAMHRACFPDDPWDAPAIGRILELTGAFGFLAWEGDDPAGFLLARDLGGEIEILSLGVVPGRRRRGHGRALMRAAIAEAGQRGTGSLVLEVAAANDAARRLYAGLGFLPVGRRPRYYRHAGGAADAFILRRTFTGEAPPR
jgi:tRNA threonylcarbamoyladenosine biosynthesis protein TsaB